MKGRMIRALAFSLPLCLASLALAAPNTIEDCAPCHGADGVARDDSVPNLAGQNQTYLFNQLQAFRSGQRRHREMRYMSQSLSDADLSALAAYFSALPPR